MYIEFRIKFSNLNIRNLSINLKKTYKFQKIQISSIRPKDSLMCYTL